MLKKILVSLVLLSSFTALTAAQTATITDADSNLTDTQITVEFTGLPADTQMNVDSLGDTRTTATEFTSTSSGTATVGYRHNPFEDGTFLADDGWRYQVYDDAGNFQYNFNVTHGNMLLGLDTFDNGQVDSKWNVQDNSCSGGGATESNSEMTLNIDSSADDADCSVSVDYYSNISSSDIAAISMPTIESKNAVQTVVNVGGNSYAFENDVDSGNFKFYIENNNLIIERNGNQLTSFSYNKDSFSIGISVQRTYGNSEPGTTILDKFSIYPQISESAWTDVNRFNPEKELIFNNFNINQDGASGIEFSKDGSSWSGTLPSSGNSLYYRNTDSGTLKSVAVDTSELLGGLQFNPIRPGNETTQILADNATEKNVDFLYEILYERSDCSEFAGLFSSWQVIDQSTGDTISSQVYTDLEMDSGQCSFFKEFNLDENLPAGNYTWKVEFRDNNLDVGNFYNMEFEIVEAENSPVKFYLEDPQEGDTVQLNNGSYGFEFTLDADRSGTVDLYIPQESTQPIYGTTVDSGNFSTTINTGLEYDQSYEWYLLFDDSIQSDIVNFSTAAQSTDGGDDGDDGDTGGGISINIADAWYTAMSFFGIGENAANYIAAIIITLALSAILFIIAGKNGGVIGLFIGLLLSGLLQLLPGWALFVQVCLAAAIIAKIGEGVLSD